jgi:hypothetical protein
MQGRRTVVRRAGVLAGVVASLLAGAAPAAGQIPVAQALWLEGQCTGALSTSQPIINLFNTQDGARSLQWQLALDVANSCNGDFVIAKGRPVGVYDFVYLRDYGPFGAAFGVNLTPPPPGHVFQVGVPNGNPWGAIRVRFGQNTTGPALTVVDAAGRRVWELDRSGRLRFPRGGLLYEGPNGGLNWRSRSGRVTRIAPP